MTGQSDAIACGERDVGDDGGDQPAPDPVVEEDRQEEEEDWKVQVEANKSLGDASFRSGDYEEAVRHYSAALSLDPQNGTLLSNRSAAYLKLSQKSRALHDAEACVKTGMMGLKGLSRLAAALQSLGRYAQAQVEWERILYEDPTHAAARQGKMDCEAALDKILPQNNNNNNESAAAATTASDSVVGDSGGAGGSVDDLDDFFNDVDEVAKQLAQEKELADQPVATNAIKNQKKDLGTSVSQIERLLQDNYKWKNLNPYHVLDISHTATKDDIGRRYKALSLLLHPDKNRDHDRAQEAYDEVLRAKAALDDENKASHARQLVEHGMVRGQAEWEKRDASSSNDTLEDYQKRAVMKIFAQVEQQRREVEQRERSHEQRERQKEEEEVDKERNSRKFDKEWKQEERVDKRVGNWRDFSKKKQKT